MIQEVQIEPHPVSGEVEFADIKNIKFRRRDSETLEARFEVEEFGLLAIYLFCLGDGQLDGEAAGWKLAELRSLEDLEDGTEWFNSIDEADEQIGSIALSAPSQRLHHTNGSNGNGRASPSQEKDEEDDEDDDDDSYWAAYDATPNGPTPTTKRSPAPQTRSNVQVGPTSNELEYFERYMNEVQPAMDPHDPEEEGQLAQGESTLDGHSLTTSIPHSVDNDVDQMTPTQSKVFADHESSFPPLAPVITNGHSAAVEDTFHSPRPRSATSIERLEHKANNYSQAEVGIKQHISTDIKSLFRLARSAGIERVEFERIVSTELECLSLMELDE